MLIALCIIVLYNIVTVDYYSKCTKDTQNLEWECTISTNGEPYPLGNLTVGPRFPVTLNNFDQFNKVKL